LIPAFGESLREQLQDGADIEHLYCDNEIHVLVLRSDETPLCVFDSTFLTLQERGWSLVPQQEYIAQTQTVADEVSIKIVTINNMNQNLNEVTEGGWGMYDFFWPQHTLNFPEQVRVGEAFDVVLDYSFIIPSLDDDDNGVEFLNYDEPEKVCPIEACGDKQIFIHRPSYVDLLNRTDYISTDTGTDVQFIPHRSFEGGYVHPPYNNTHPQQEIFTLVINKPDIAYNYGEIEISYPQTGDEKIYFYVAPDNVVHLNEDAIYMPSEGPSQLIEDYSHLKVVNATVPQEDPSDEHIPGIAEYFMDYFPKDHDFEQELKNANFTQAFIEKFFVLYPDLRPQSFVPSMYWVMPQAFAQSPPSFSYVYGTLKYYDSSSTLTTLGNVRVCAFDTENGSLTALYNGHTQVCKFSSDNGGFSLQVPTTDPNGSGGTDLVLKAYSESPNVIVYKNNTTTFIQ
jgi:hypothetical protein